MNKIVINHDEALELAIIKKEDSNMARCYLDIKEKLQLAEDNIKNLKTAYILMRNSAAGYSNLCPDYNATSDRCDREYEKAEKLFRSLNT